MKDSLKPGIKHTMTYQVPEERTVPHLLPEAVEYASMPKVFATGYMVGVIEWACLQTLEGHLDDTEITLGKHVNLSHQAPTVPGSVVTIDIEVTKVSGRHIEFAVEARDELAVISKGTHARGVANRESFQQLIDQQHEKLS